jgi:predicted enzyme related to lactoylglutathione lyase
MHGICHIEIPCSDFDRVAKFYHTVFDWKVDRIPGMDDYMTFKPPEGLGGGFTRQLKPAPKDNGIFLYIMVSDIEAMQKKIETAGGKNTMQKTPIPGIGHFSVFVDTEGNNMGLFSM